MSITTSSGCSDWVAGSGGLIPVSGIILCGSDPLKSGTVHFEPVENSEEARPASGPIIADGRFQLTTDGSPGAFRGRYRVIVNPAKGQEDDRMKSKAGIVCVLGDTGQTVIVSVKGRNDFKIRLAGPDGPRDGDTGE